MKIYNYKTGKAVFVNNEKIEISNKVAEILENYTMFPGNMYQDLGIDKPKWKISKVMEKITLMLLLCSTKGLYLEFTVNMRDRMQTVLNSLI